MEAQTTNSQIWNKTVRVLRCILTNFYEEVLYIDRLTNEDLLKFAVLNGIINLDEVRNSMEEKEKQRLLDKHKYKVFQDKDGRWKTTLPDDTRKSKRRLIAKSKLDDLQKEIITYYASAEDVEYEKSNLITLRTVFPEWLTYKNSHTNATSYIKRLKTDWNKYYENDEIIDIPISELTYLTLDAWAHNLVKKYSMTKVQYYNMSVIIRQMLDYVVEKYSGKYIEENQFSRVKINAKMFRKKVKPKNETQVFNPKDEKEICELALKKYYLKPKSISGLAIALNFNLGLRMGELAALKWSDINGHYIHIQRMEVADWIVGDNGDVKNNGYKVVNHTKSSAGDRVIYLNEKAREILGIIKERNETYGLYDDGYIFVNLYSKRLHAKRLNPFLYGLCDEINTNRRSSHKIRKTYISSLFDGGLNINKIREIAGHEDEETSLHNYCFDRKLDVETEQILEDISKK